MSTRVRSYSKINLGLAIGPVRTDGFHGLTTVYQTLELHDLVTVEARLLGAGVSRISIGCNHAGVPLDSRNTVWRMVEGALAALGVAAEVHVEIEKRLPVQGGLGAGSANAVAALVGLERELGLVPRELLQTQIPPLRSAPVGMTKFADATEEVTNFDVEAHVPPLPLHGVQGPVGMTNFSDTTGRTDSPGRLKGLSGRERLQLAAGVGSDVPLFFIGGAVLGLGRGEEVSALPDFPSYECVVAVPGVSVSTPQAFRDWDARKNVIPLKPKEGLNGAPAIPLGDLTLTGESGTLSKLSRAYASAFGASFGSRPYSSGVSPQRGDLAENPLLALVRTGIDNDFERVVFPQYPLLGDIKRTLAVSDPESPEQSAIYAALSGSGSAVFGLYATTEAADAAQRRLGELGITSLKTRTLGRTEYWREMIESG
jgi:4-diphosphocytidyl-2-C-methyl-D-erythritol kinase